VSTQTPDEQEIGSGDVGQLSDVLGEQPLDRDPQRDPDDPDQVNAPEPADPEAEPEE
jgi:hypothetical protein